MNEVGFAVSIKGFVLEIDGLPKVRVNDVLESDKGSRAFVFSLESTRVQALLLTSKKVEIGEEFKKISDGLTIGVGEGLLGRVIGPMGEILDGGRRVENLVPAQIERIAPGVSSRKFIDEQEVTGITVVDTVIPLGKGQRELIVGDARSGKTSFILDLIVNLKKKDTICIFASVGRPATKLWNFVNVLGEQKALEKVVVVASFPADPTPLIFITPKAAMAVAEYFREKGKEVIIIMDDLGVHARIYREISLLLGRFPGREGYPGDIFYQHSSLLERAGSFSKEAGGGSITALPVIEINLDDFTGYIPTNLMSMTDGHLLFNSSLIAQGKRPGIDISLSVSRVGRQTQSKVHVELSLKIRQILSQAVQFEAIAGFGGELPLSTRQILKQRDFIEECLKQGMFEYLSPADQCLLLTLPFMKEMQDLSVEQFVAGKHVFISELGRDKELVDLSKRAFEFKKWSDLLAEMEKMSGKIKTIFKVQGDQDQLVDQETWKPKI